LNPSFATHCGKGAAAPVDEHPGLRKNAGMAEPITNDWADRQRAQAAGFDAIGPRYDEVLLLEQLSTAHKCGTSAAARVCQPLGSSSTEDRGYRRRHLAGDA
jgi:hypothetical protein